jgi:branched-chain amino acid transport system substrate-binding protein
MLDDGGAGGGFDPKRETHNALTCAGRSDTFGYIGPLNSGAAVVSQPLLNRAAMVQISPSNTVVILTSRPLRAAQQPATYHHRLAYLTYYRMLTTDALQGPSDAAFLKIRAHARTYVLVDDYASSHAALAGSMAAYAGKIGLRLVGTVHIDLAPSSDPPSVFGAAADVILARHPDGVLYAGEGHNGMLPRLLRSKGYAGPLVGTDSTLNPAYAAGAGRPLGNTYATEPLVDPAAVAPSFRRAYARRFHIALQGYDAPAYDAANIVLHAIYQAAAQGKLHGTLRTMRAAVLPNVAKVRWHGAIGVTSFDRNGDTRNRIVSVYKVRAGKWVFVGIAPPVRGVSPAG